MKLTPDPQGSEGTKAGRSQPPSFKVPSAKGVLVVDKVQCTSCMQCMHTCALFKEGVGSWELARIQMAAHTNYTFENSAKPCQQCVKPQCMIACPHGAIYADELSGTNARAIAESKCEGCRTCIEACPFTPPRIRYDCVKMKSIKCDLCGGDPQCVKVCPTGALTYKLF